MPFGFESNLRQLSAPLKQLSANRQVPPVNGDVQPGTSCDNLSQIMRKAIQRYAIVLAAWLPFFAIWVLFAMVYAHYALRAALAASLISMGSASVLGIAVWHVCRRRPWPLRLDVKFYLLQVFLAVMYAVLWSIATYWLDALRRGNTSLGLLEVALSWLAVADGTLAVRLVRRSFVRCANAEPVCTKKRRWRRGPKPWPPRRVWTQFARV